MIKQRTIMKYISTLIVALLPAVSLNAQTVTPLEQQVETDSLTINTEVNVVMPEIDTYPFFGHRSRLSFSVGSGSGHVMATRPRECRRDRITGSIIWKTRK